MDSMSATTSGSSAQPAMSRVSDASEAKRNDKATQTEQAIMQDLLQEFKGLRRDNAVVFDLLKKTLDNKADEKTNDRSLEEISGNFEIKPLTVPNRRTPYDLRDATLPRSDRLESLFNKFIDWIGNTKLSPDEVSKLPRIQLSTSTTDGGATYSRPPKTKNIPEGTQVCSRDELKRLWPTNIPDVLSEQTWQMDSDDSTSNEEIRLLIVDQRWPAAGTRGSCLKIHSFQWDPDARQLSMKRTIGNNTAVLKMSHRLPWKEICGTHYELDARWICNTYGILPFQFVALLLPIITTWNDKFDFISYHASPWPSHEIRSISQDGNRHFFLSIHLRAFIPNFEVPTLPKFPEKDGVVSAGLRLDREHASLSCLNGDEITFTERRYSLAVNVSPFESPPTGQFAIVSLVDFFNVLGSRTYEGSFFYGGDVPLEHGLLPCRMLTGIAYFQNFVCAMIMKWSSDWSSTLLKLENSFALKASDVLNKDTVDIYMFDSDELKQSRSYFSFLQLLRISSEWITRNMDDLERVTEVFKSLNGESIMLYWAQRFENGRDDFSDAAKVIAYNWDIVIELHRKKGQELLDRISQNTETVESLRDGLFNALSVREALKGTRINQYLLVFTVVTIIFLPPSFIATFYGMHLFDGLGDIAQTQKQFWISFVLVAAITYLGAILALSSIQQRQMIRGWFNKTLFLTSLLIRRDGKAHSSPAELSEVHIDKPGEK